MEKYLSTLFIYPGCQRFFLRGFCCRSCLFVIISVRRTREKTSGTRGTFSLRMQTYFRLSLVSTENNIYEPKPGNDFCDVMIVVSPWPIRFHDRMKLECSLQRISHAVVLGLLELNCDWLKIPTSQKLFPGSSSQTLYLAETSDSQKYVCVRRLGYFSPSYQMDKCRRNYGKSDYKAANYKNTHAATNPNNL